MEEMNDQVGREESAPSSSGKKPRANRTRLPARFASHFFELSKTLGFKRHGQTVEWLIQQSETDQDPHKFSLVDELLISSPQDRILMMTPRKRPRQPGRPQVAKDRHRRTEDGRDRRVQVPNKCLSQLIQLTQKLALKSNGQTIEWLFKKYRLSSTRPLQAIHSNAAPNSTSAFTDTNFNGSHLILDNETMIIPTDFSIPSHDHQQNLVGHYEQQQFMEHAFNANPNSEQYGIAPASQECDLYLRDSANHLQSTSYPQLQTVIQPDSISFQSWMPNATNDGLIMEGRRVHEPLGQYGIAPASHPCDLDLWDSANHLQSTSYPQQQTVIQPDSINVQSWVPNATNDGFIVEGRRVQPQNFRYLNPEHEYTGSSRAMAGERLAEPAENLSYAEQVWNPNNTCSISIPQTYCPQNQYSLPYEGINIGTGESAEYNIINTNGSSNGIAINSAQQLFSQGLVGNGFGEVPIIPQDHRYNREMQQPAHSIINSSNNAISMNLPYLQQQLCYQGTGGHVLGEGRVITQDQDSGTPISWRRLSQ